MSVRILIFLVALCLLPANPATAQRVEPVSVGVVVNPYAGDRAGPLRDDDAEAMTRNIHAVIEGAGGRLATRDTVALTPEEEAEYGQWHKFGLASGHLADLVSRNRAEGLLNIGFYNNCESLMGMLGGLRHGSRPPARVGLVWFDAHGDYNTPETTLSGMLGGMPVAIAVGDALERLRTQAKLDEPLPKDQVLMVGVRDLDPLERARVEADRIPVLSTDDVRALSPRLRTSFEQLHDRVDVVYVHVDLDVLDPSDVSGHPLTVPNGPTGEELARAIELMFTYPRTAALGIASYPHRNDPGERTLGAVERMVAAAIQGARTR